MSAQAQHADDTWLDCTFSPAQTLACASRMRHTWSDAIKSQQLAQGTYKALLCGPLIPKLSRQYPFVQTCADCWLICCYARPIWSIW